MAEALKETPKLRFENWESVTMPHIALSLLVPQIGRIGSVPKIATQTVSFFKATFRVDR